MEELKKLIDVLEHKGKLSASALLNYADGANLETKLYHLLKNEAPESEQLLIEKLYGTPDRHNAYKMLKVRVRKKLHNQLFFLDTENKKIVDNLVAIELKCQRALYLANALHKLQEPNLAEQQLKRAHLLAKEAGIVKYEIDALEQLRYFIAERSYDRKAYDKVIAELQELYSIQVIEREADRIYFQVRFGSKLGVEMSKQYLLTLSNEIAQLRKHWLVTGSNHIFKRYHQLTMYYYEFTGEFEALITYLKETFLLYNAGKIHKAYFSTRFNKFLLCFALLRAKQFDEGLREAELLKDELDEKSANWFAHMENYFLLAVHSKDYPKAEELLHAVLKNKYLNQLTTFAQERWLLFYKILNYVTGFTSKAYANQKLKYALKDKKGYNVWSLIIDFVQALQNQNAELVEREVERIRKFAGKYLTPKEDPRTILFLKLLSLAGRNYNDVAACKHKGKYLFKKLRSTPASGVAYAETEIIPYEELWEIVLQKLGDAK